MSIVHRIEYVAIETSPLRTAFDQRSGESDLVLVADYADTSEPFTAAIWIVAADQVDGCSCWNCAAPVGYVLHEYDDDPARSGCHWHPVWLVREHDGPVATLCEDCAPLVPTEPATARVDWPSVAALRPGDDWPA